VILVVPVVALAAVALTVFLVGKGIGVALPGHERWSGWRRPLVAVFFACAASATVFYSLGVLTLMMTVSTAQDGGADSAPLPYDHPCRIHLTGAVDYQVQFLTLRTLCVMEDGKRIAVDDVPQEVRMGAAASVVAAAVSAGAVGVTSRRLFNGSVSPGESSAAQR
jgi:hypothetical protein